MYSNDAAKVAEVIDQCTKAGRWLPDEFFPNDVTERHYLLPTAITFREEEVNEDIQELSGKHELSTKDASALVAE
eukprot:765120-Alexandrium_andersonii.AAC.1